MRSPTLLVIGHDFPSGSVPVQAGTLAGWAGDRGVAVRTAMAREGLPDPLRVADEVDAVAVLGSLEGAWDDAVPWLAEEIDYLRAAADAGVGILGLCFGGQLLARVLGGRALRAGAAEHGWRTVTGSVGPGPWLEFHDDAFTAPPGATVLASSPACTQAFAHGPHLGVQFHPEITPEGFEIWAAHWAGTPFESERLPALGLSTAGMRAGIAAHARESAAASRALFDRFATRAGLAARMLAS